MKSTLLKKQIPTLFALVILFVGAAVGIVLVGRGTKFLPRAGPEHDPKQIQLTNITDRTFTVSWITDTPTTGYLRYGTTSSLGTTATDDRDQLSGETSSFKTHHVTVRGLTPSTKYYFKIGSGPSSTLYDNNGNPYEVTTGASLNIPPEAETAYGTVVTASQTPAENAIVYLKLAGAAPLSTLVKASGSWAIPLSTIRKASLDDYLVYDPQNETITLEAISPLDGLKTTGTTLTSNDQPVPNITLGQNFDFTSGDSDPVPASPSPTPTSQFEVDPDTLPADTDLILHNPSQDGEVINTQQPEIVGSAPPGATLEIILESPTTYTDQVSVDDTGQFSWTPPENLEPGEHTLTIKYVVDGIQKIFTRTFVVNAQTNNDLLSFTASPSASPTTSPRPSPSPTSSPTPSPSPSPTPLASPSPTPRVTSPTPVATSAAMLQAGSVSPTFLLLFLGFSFVAVGMFWLNKSSSL